jgi:predicted transcriptional regulator
MRFGTFGAIGTDIDQFWNHGHMQEVAAMSQSVLEMTKDLVVAQIQAGSLSPEDVPGAIRRIYQSLITLMTFDASLMSAPVIETPQAPVDWRTSITENTITCLECGVILKQLSGRHLHLHGFNARTYRLKYGIPQDQPLAARETAAKQREMLKRIRPWELQRSLCNRRSVRGQQPLKKPKH